MEGEQQRCETVPFVLTVRRRAAAFWPRCRLMDDWPKTTKSIRAIKPQCQKGDVSALVSRLQLSREENRPKTGDLLVELECIVKMHRRENEELTVVIPSSSRCPGPQSRSVWCLTAVNYYFLSQIWKLCKFSAKQWDFIRININSSK